MPPVALEQISEKVSLALPLQQKRMGWQSAK